MNHLLERFLTLERELAVEKGNFVLFSLLERDDAQGKWDVVVSAPWLRPEQKESMHFIVDRIRAKFKAEELVSLSRVVLLSPTDAFVRNVNSAVQVEHGKAELINNVFNGMQIKHAFLITSKRPSPNKESKAAATA